MGLAAWSCLDAPLATALIEPAHHQQHRSTGQGAAAAMLEWCLSHALPCLVSTTCSPTAPTSSSKQHLVHLTACNSTPRPPFPQSPKKPDPLPVTPAAADRNHNPLRRCSRCQPAHTHNNSALPGPLPAPLHPLPHQLPPQQQQQAAAHVTHRCLTPPAAAAEQTATPWLTTGKRMTGRGKTSSLCCQAPR